MKYRCPTCNKYFDPLRKGQFEKADFFPFCSERCKLIDLGAWLDVRYKVVSSMQSQESDIPSNTSTFDSGNQ